MIVAWLAQCRTIATLAMQVLTIAHGSTTAMRLLQDAPPQMERSWNLPKVSDAAMSWRNCQVAMSDASQCAQPHMQLGQVRQPL